MLIAAAFIILFICLAGALLWRLAIYALPLWCGGAATLWAYASDFGLAASILAGLAAATAILILGYWTLGAAKSPSLRMGVAAAFALPAAIAGFHAAHGIAIAFAVGGRPASFLSAIASLATGVAAWGGILCDRHQS